MAALLTVVESFVPFKPSGALLFSPLPGVLRSSLPGSSPGRRPGVACIFVRTDTDFLLDFTLFDFYFLSQKSELSFSATRTTRTTNLGRLTLGTRPEK